MHRRQFCRRLGSLGSLGAVAGGLAGCVDRGAPGGSPSSTPASGTPDDDGDGWPTFGADRGNTGVRDDGSPPSVGDVLWTGIGDAPTVLCSPTVRDGTVYVGSAADRVHAFDAVSGDLEWAYETDTYVPVAPAVRGGRVYTADADGTVYALTTDGDEVWTRATDHNLHSRALAVADGTVFVSTAGTMPAVVSGDTTETKESLVIALDAGTGERRWAVEAADWFTGPALGEGRVFVGNHTGEVFALEASSGEVAWSWKAGDTDSDLPAGAVLAPPAYRDGGVYLGVHATGEAVALDAASGDVRWRRSLEVENVKCSPAVDGDRVYLAGYRVRAHASAPTEASGDGGTSTSTPTATPTAPPESGTTGRLYALNRQDGSEGWQHETDHDVRSSPAVVGDAVVIGGGEGLHAVARADGSPRWSVTFGDFVDSSPAVVDGRAYIGSADGTLYCVGDG